ncbi:hypothetical protein ROZALSC1DRAFT_27971 [Rozella allomycis CSF55]|uniref:Uncharacterized protein n=1 Tax=Rozella allomycis (strain CSF55) TaxID=988480 RepID=A0A075B0W6_ROZAC|nr:hypothetical protein O9G_002044 [Rozella allomycis CSF55]RKP20555.1 hypothetical protein ROZALSC1DRAFT_27971 [Rozella allomycis CSF55]|eukprot:EPZ34471.1 hypothetical protein O9G_002044 [Rozella allomycis CSF55]
MKKVIDDFLINIAENGDIQTCSVACILLRDLIPLDKIKICKQWIEGYIELLKRRKLWVQVTRIVNACQTIPSIYSLNQVI